MLEVDQMVAMMAARWADELVVDLVVWTVQLTAEWKDESWVS